MGDEFDYEDDEDTDAPSETNVISNLRKENRDLKKQAKAAAEAQAEAQALKRTMAFIDAGIPKTKQSEYFMKGYDGDYSVEAIRQAAIDAGFLEDTTTDATSDEVEAHGRIANASSGAGTDSFDHDAAIAAAETVEDIIAASQRAGYPTTWDG